MVAMESEEASYTLANCAIVAIAVMMAMMSVTVALKHKCQS
jgi:hypothetical protein